MLQGLGGERVAERLDFSEVDAGVVEGAFGELARFGGSYLHRPCVFLCLCGAPRDGVEHAADDGWAAVDVEFEDVFACCGVWAGKVEDQGACVKNVGGVDGICEPAKGGDSRSGWLTAWTEAGVDGETCWARDANDGYGGAAGGC